MSPYCDNCGAHVTDDYRRVFEVDGELGACPFCPARTRGRDGRTRDVRTRSTKEGSP